MYRVCNLRYDDVYEDGKDFEEVIDAEGYAIMRSVNDPYGIFQSSGEDEYECLAIVYLEDTFWK